jgi:hypothetical protein
MMGVTWDELPSMSFNMLDSRVLPYPRYREVSKNSMFDWFDDLFKGRNHEIPTDFSKEVKDTEIESLLLNNTISVTRDNYREVVLEEGFDVVLLLYTTEIVSNTQRNIAL